MISENDESQHRQGMGVKSKEWSTAHGFRKNPIKMYNIIIQHPVQEAAAGAMSSEFRATICHSESRLQWLRATFRRQHHCYMHPLHQEDFYS
jgi:hypothetical protein